MNSLFSASGYQEILNRVNQLGPNSQALWGEMDVAQMMAHCVEVMRNSMGEIQQNRKPLGYLVAPFLRKRYYNDIPFKSRNVPSTFKVTQAKDFAREKENLLNRLENFHTNGPEACKGAIHPMLGRFTPEQWAIGQFKHVDHHLRQFGV
ncbi:MAG: DUF1569 domain-containing protein [Bacteroidota bacterium]